MSRPRKDEIKALAHAILSLAPEKRAELVRTIALVEELGQPIGAHTIAPQRERTASVGRRKAKPQVEAPSA